jgi:glycosyltransferase involved in cell wall biosynthesis
LQVGDDSWSTGARADQALINQLAFGVPSIVYTGFPAFVEDAENAGCVPAYRECDLGVAECEGLCWVRESDIVATNRYESTARSIEELLILLDRMHTGTALRQALSERGRVYAENYSPEMVAHAYLMQLASVQSLR